MLPFDLWNVATSPSLIKYLAMKENWRLEVSFHIFLTSALLQGEDQFDTQFGLIFLCHQQQQSVSQDTKPVTIVRTYFKET